MGCRQSQKQQGDPLPLINMLVVGLSDSGKSTILNLLKGEPGAESSPELGIDTFVINNQLKIIAFEVAGRALSTWHYYYATSTLVLFIIDSGKIEQLSKIQQIVEEMDKSLPQKAKIVIAFNKIDLFIEKQSRKKIPDYEEASHFTEIVSSMNPKIKMIEKLKFNHLLHEVITCKCSGKDKIGITAIMKKIHRLGMNHILGKNKSTEDEEK